VYANDDFANIQEDEVVDIPVLTNDFGLNNGVQSLEIINPPKYGTVEINADNTIKYTPDLSYVGEDAFDYRVCNNNGSCGKATVEIVVNNVDFIPVAVNDTVDYLHGSEIFIPVLKNDTLKGDFPYSLSIETEFIHGDAIFNDKDELVPVFDRKYNGLDSLKYRLCDADNDCDEAWVIVTVKHDITKDFLIPEGFSPNGDGINDTFYVPDFSTYLGINLTIIDTWGKVAFQTGDYSNDWDGIGNTGKYNGKLVPAGTYYYIVTIEGLDKKLTGFVYVAK